MIFTIGFFLLCVSFVFGGFAAHYRAINHPRTRAVARVAGWLFIVAVLLMIASFLILFYRVLP